MQLIEPFQPNAYPYFLVLFYLFIWTSCFHDWGLSLLSHSSVWKLLTLQPKLNSFYSVFIVMLKCKIPANVNTTTFINKSKYSVFRAHLHHCSWGCVSISIVNLWRVLPWHSTALSWIFAIQGFCSSVIWWVGFSIVSNTNSCFCFKLYNCFVGWGLV